MKRNFTLAADLIHLSLLLSLVCVIISISYAREELSLDGTSFILILAVSGFVFFLGYMIAKEEKWAIWVFTILVVLRLLTSSQFENAFDKNIFYVLVITVQWIIQFFALYLIHEHVFKSILGIKVK